MKSYKDIPFKQVEGHELFLDIYLPEDVQNPPLIMWIHGGGWAMLNRNWNLVMPMLDRGYAIASVDYRYSDEGAFPTQMYDLKDALHYLKTHAGEYGYDASKVVVSGDSAGGHLAVMMGVSVGNKDWETQEGDYSLQAVVDFCGAVKISAGSNPEDGWVFTQLLGTELGTKTAVARAAFASPVNHIDGTEPPFLILHGSEDPVVSPEHPRTLRNALEAAGTPVHMYFIPGGHHGLSGKLVDDIIAEFLDYYLNGKKTVITPDVLDCHQRTVPVVKK